jgi:hypothetical protein
LYHDSTRRYVVTEASATETGTTGTGTTGTGTTGAPATSPDELRIKYGYRVILGGFILVAVVLLVAIWRWEVANDVALVVGLFTSMVGTVIGAFFGIQVGSQGKEEALAAREQAETKADAALGALPKNEARQVLQDVGAI